MKKKFLDYAKALNDAGFVINTSKEDYGSFDLSIKETAYLLSLLGKRYYGFRLYKTFFDFYKDKAYLINPNRLNENEK